jgi:hypothetical protein
MVDPGVAASIDDGEFDRKADFAVVRHQPCEPLTQVVSAAMDASEDRSTAVYRRSA